MDTRRPRQNPFDTPKASHFSADEILELYVDAQGENEELVNGFLEPRSTTPLRLLGGKGSGKTHLLRYCSYPVRTRKHGGNLIDAIRNDGYIGIYVDSGALNAQKFHGKRLDKEQWQTIFGYYFEMWLVHHFLTVMTKVSSLSTDAEDYEFDEDAFLEQASKLFDVDLAKKIQSLEDLQTLLAELRKNVDYRSNNAALRETFSDLDIVFSPGNLIFGIAEAFKDACPELGGATITYMIDEVENFSELQQTFFNSLIRFRDGKVTFKIGSRLYGIQTDKTMHDGEPIKRGSEFEEVHLDDYLRSLSEKKYQDFALKLVAKRLNQSGINCPREKEEKLHLDFESVDPKDNYASECLSILYNTDKGNRERPYFRKFRRLLSENSKINNGVVDGIVNDLTCREHPLVEKASLMLFYRGVDKPGASAVFLASSIAESAEAYVAGDKAKGSKHVNILEYYKTDLLAQLYRELQYPVVYCGFDTIVTLSQGIPRNLLMILKHIYRRSLFAGEDPFEDGQISKQSQTDGIKDGAQWFWEDAQPETNAASVRLSVEAIATLFRTVRYSLRPSEPALSSFSVKSSELSEKARRTLKTAENWSYLVHIPRSGSDKNTEDRREKYQLVPMLAPKWDVSYARRGTIEIAKDFANSLLDESYREDLRLQFNRRTVSMLEDGIFKHDDGQEKLL